MLKIFGPKCMGCTLPCYKPHYSLLERKRPAKLSNQSNQCFGEMHQKLPIRFIHEIFINIMMLGTGLTLIRSTQRLRAVDTDSLSGEQLQFSVDNVSMLNCPEYTGNRTTLWVTVANVIHEFPSVISVAFHCFHLSDCRCP